MEEKTTTMLIGGTGRSGTTVLAKIFAQHPKVATLPEWRLMTDPGGIIEFLAIVEAGNPFAIDQAFKRFSKYVLRLESKDYISRIASKFFPILEKLLARRITHKYYNFYAPGHAATFSQRIRKLLRDINDLGFEGKTAATERGQSHDVFSTSLRGAQLEQAFSEFLCGLARDVMKERGKTRFLEKNTWTILSFDKVSRLYPDSKLIHIYRDPRDVIASYKTQPWMPSDPEKAAVVLRGLYEKWDEQSSLVDSSRWIEVGLESVISDTESTLKKMCDFWELDIAQEMFQIRLSHSSTNRWKQDLSNKEVAIIENTLGDYMGRYASQ